MEVPDPPPSPARSAWAMVVVPWLRDCARFIRRAQAGGDRPGVVAECHHHARQACVGMPLQDRTQERVARDRRERLRWRH